ncbi:hypothetical protein ACH5RR_025887 [Cinchona calisaya]|uniref:Uncharacterized protein n=1 Tax=Cinchona calisaya TaxID=153742 RepID=A0ABD2Z0X0_9GENT
MIQELRTFHPSSTGDSGLLRFVSEFEARSGRLVGCLQNRSTWKNRGTLEGTSYQQVEVTRPIEPDMHDIPMLHDPSGEIILVDDIEIYLPQLGQFEISDAEEEELDSNDDDDAEEENKEYEANDFDFE